MNLIHISQCSTDFVYRLFARADEFQQNFPGNLLADKTIVLLFYEPSTRTRCSFELAAKNLGAKVINVFSTQSSIQKGETLLDTIENLGAMGVDMIILRHKENGIMEYIDRNSAVKIISAGEGTLAHPTQAMLDAYTIKNVKKDFSSLTVAIVGDICHSRVAHSNIELLNKLGVKAIHLIGPKSFLPEKPISGCKFFTDLKAGLTHVDVIMALRIQQERMIEAEVPNLKDYSDAYGIKIEHLNLAKSDAMVMHPGPINRDVEIDSSVANCKQSFILTQVKNGIYIRMALLSMLLK